MEHRQYEQVAPGVDAIAAALDTLAGRIEDIKALAAE